MLKGNLPTDWREAIYYRYWQHILHRDVAAHLGIRTKTQKLIYYYGQPLGMTSYEATKPEWEFFNLVRDPKEMRNAYADPQYKLQIDSLTQQLRELKAYFGDSDENFPEMPTF